MPTYTFVASDSELFADVVPESDEAWLLSSTLIHVFCFSVSIHNPDGTFASYNAHHVVGIFIMHLWGDKQIQDFEIFIQDDPESTSYDDTFTDDDDDRSPLWMELEREMRDDYEEMQRTRKAQQVEREQKKFERIEMQVQ